MMRDRRRMLLTQLGSSFAIPTYTGSHAIFGDEKQGYIECYTTGTITFPKAGVVDVFVLGSGLKGDVGRFAGSTQAQGGKGGKGAIGTTLTAIDVEGEYTITVGAACSSTTSANKSIAFGTTANSTKDNGGDGAVSTLSSNTGWSNNGKSGSDGTSYPFTETSGTFYKRLGAGGGGGATYFSNSINGYYTGSGKVGNGGTLGGGKGADSRNTTGYAATANTGSGGGGGYAQIFQDSSGETDTTVYTNGGNGGSGIVIIRWGYAA